MFDTKTISSFIESTLTNTEKIIYSERIIHLVDKETMQTLQLYQNQLLQSGEDIFSKHCKLINPTFPSFKYTLARKHKYTAVFDQNKTKERLDREISISINTIKRKKNQELSKRTDITDEEAKKLKLELEEELQQTKLKLEQIKQNIDEYQIIFTNFEKYLYYPYIYYKYIDAKGKKLNSSEHLKKDIPNILWFEPLKEFNTLRNNDKIRKIIKTHKRYLENIYIIKKDDLNE